MKIMKYKKVIISIIIIVVLMAIILLALFFRKSLVSNFVENIEYDVKISKIEKFTVDGGYAFTDEYRLVNLEKKKLYIISDYYVYGDTIHNRNGHDYNIKIKNLTNEQIEKIEQLYNIESNDIQNDKFNDYWEIEYNNKIVELYNLPFKDDLW